MGDALFPTLGNGGYDVAHYDLDLKVHPATGGLEATANIHANATIDLGSFNLDLVGLEVESVTVDGQSADWRREARELVITPGRPLAQGSAFEVMVSYSGVPDSAAGAMPFGAGWQTVGDLVYVINQPDGASTWFPANDHPIDTATFQISLDVPDGYQTVTSGIALSGLDDPDLPDVWEIPEETPPYLVALAVGAFERTDHEPWGDVDLALWHHPETPEPVLVPFDSHPAMLAYFSNRFGPYPFSRYGALLIDDPELPAALETQTLSTFGYPIMGLGEAVVAHELVHQWFGNHLRLESWDDIWLNEGFATFGEWLWLEESEGALRYAAEVAGAYEIMSGAVFATETSSGAAEARRRFPPPAHPTAEDMFNPSVYLRGGLALVALRDEVGDDVMWEMVEEWASRFGGTTVTTADFVDLVEEMAGADAVSILLGHLEDDLPPAMPGRRLEPPSD